jgi:heterodisulfide reductase subunit A-like polyferredoxin
MTSENEGTIGVYLCSESGEIGNWIDLESVAEFMRQFNDVIEVSVHNELSSKEGLDYLVNRYFEMKFDRVLIGGAVPTI